MTGAGTKPHVLFVRGIPEDLHRQLKRTVAMHDMTIKEFLVMLLQRYVGPGGSMYVSDSRDTVGMGVEDNQET